jgi:hypothetical protein
LSNNASGPAARDDTAGGSDEGGSDPDPIEEAALSAPMDSLFQQSLLGRNATKSVGGTSQPSRSPTQTLGNQDSQHGHSSASLQPSSDPVGVGICLPDEGERLFIE